MINGEIESLCDKLFRVIGNKKKKVDFISCLIKVFQMFVNFHFSLCSVHRLTEMNRLLCKHFSVLVWCIFQYSQQQRRIRTIVLTYFEITFWRKLRRTHSVIEISKHAVFNVFDIHFALRFRQFAYPNFQLLKSFLFFMIFCSIIGNHFVSFSSVFHHPLILMGQYFKLKLLFIELFVTRKILPRIGLQFDQNKMNNIDPAHKL